MAGYLFACEDTNCQRETKLEAEQDQIEELSGQSEIGSEGLHVL